MRALLAPSLQLSLVGRLTATNPMRRLEAAQVKHWEVILSLWGVRGEEVEVRIGLRANWPNRELDTISRESFAALSRTLSACSSWCCVHTSHWKYLLISWDRTKQKRGKKVGKEESLSMSTSVQNEDFDATRLTRLC
jgi:hypothetical protein